MSKIIDITGGVFTPEMIEEAVEQSIANFGKFHQPVILGLEHGVSFDRSIDEWLRVDKITKEDIKCFPNAKAANKLRNTKLYKALK